MSVGWSLLVRFKSNIDPVITIVYFQDYEQTLISMLAFGTVSHVFTCSLCTLSS